MNNKLLESTSRPLTIFCFFVFFFLTQNIIFDLEVLEQKGFGLATSYLAISNCWIDNVCGDLGSKFPDHHLLRSIPYFFVGFIATITATSVETVCIVIICLFFFASTLVISKSFKNYTTFLLILFFVLANPYTFRLYFYSPLILVDMIFFCSILFFSAGVINKNNALILSSIFLATISRQTSIFFIPILILLYMFNHIDIRMLIKSSFIFVILFLTNIFISSYFFEATANSSLAHIIDINKNWLGSNRSNGGSYKEFILLVLFNVFLLYPSIFVKLNKNCILLFLFCYLTIIAQPLISGPFTTGGNYSRTVAYGLPLICLIIKDQDIRSTKLIPLTVCIVFLSFHHHYSISPDKSFYTIIVIFVFCYVLLFYVVVLFLNAYKKKKNV